MQIVMNTLDYINQKFKPQYNKFYGEIEGGRGKELLTMFRELGFKTGAEIGIERGVFSEKICKSVPGVKLYCIDPWQFYPGYREHVSQDQLDGFYEETKEKLKPYGCIVIKGFSEEVHKDIPDGSLDFVYIDGNHDFLHTTQDLFYWTPKVRAEGIVSGHDFKRTRHGAANHVKDVIPAWAYAHGIRPWFVLNEKETGTAPSWFWVKN
jgi:hypothetical protein